MNVSMFNSNIPWKRPMTVSPFFRINQFWVMSPRNC
ncbi:hypothetical protein ABIB26_001826 [Arthrobacter sp. UYEF20]